jgi:hypothetical protein
MSEVILWTGVGHEAFQDVLVEDTFGVLSGLVGHEAVYEGEGCLRDLDTSENIICEVMSWDTLRI